MSPETASPADTVFMEAALDSISQDVFDTKPVVQTEENEETQDGLAGKEAETESEEDTPAERAERLAPSAATR